MTTTPPPSLPFAVGTELRLLKDNAPFKAGARVRIDRINSLLATGNHAPLTSDTVTYKISGHSQITARFVDHAKAVKKVGHKSLSLTPKGQPSDKKYTRDQEVYLIKDVNWVIGRDSGQHKEGTPVVIYDGPYSHTGSKSINVTGSFYNVAPVVLRTEDKWSPAARHVLHQELAPL